MRTNDRRRHDRRAARRARPAAAGDEVHITTGPLYHSGPLVVRAARPRARRHHRRAPQVRPESPGSGWSRSTASPNTFSAPTQLKRIVSLPPGSWPAPTCRRCACLIANAAPVPYALEAGSHREVGRRLPLRGVRLHRAGRGHGAAARPTSCASRVRVASTYGPIEVRIVTRRRHRGGGGGAGRAVHPHHARDGRLPPHRRAASREHGTATGSRWATSRTSTTRATSSSVTARRT